MLGAATTLLLHGFHLCLRLTGRNGSFPRPLSSEEEAKALRGMEEGDAKARDQLILHNLRLVAHVIKKYYTQAGDQDDLLSVGTIGLVKAIDSYRPNKNVKLPTYACKCIQNEIFMHFRGQKKRNGDISLNEPLDKEGDGAQLSVLDVLQVEDFTQERIELDETYTALLSLVETALDERQKQLIKMRYGLDGKLPMTQKEVAAELGISRSYVSRIEKRILEILEEGLRKNQMN